MSLAYTNRMIYDAAGYTGNTYYARLVRKADGFIWDPVNGEIVVAPSWADSVVLLEEVGGSTGQYKVPISAVVPRYVYDVIIYLQAGSEPANTDDVQLQYDTSVGSIFGF